MQKLEVGNINILVLRKPPPEHLTSFYLALQSRRLQQSLE